jgi:hypothetical protein
MPKYIQIFNYSSGSWALLSQKQLHETLHLAREAAGVYEVPGQSD